jgi:uncharacterized protein involved in exopolysaccharide biosynthesis/Mrp family chromosome partitioning ATPase
MLFPTTDLKQQLAAPGEQVPHPLMAGLSHLLQFKWWIAGAAVAGFLVTGVWLCFVTPEYEAQAVVIVDSRRNKLADAESALSSIVIDQYQTALKSELELIRSPDLARHVIDGLGLLSTPEYRSAITHRSTASRFQAMRMKLLAGLRAGLARIGLPGVLPQAAAAAAEQTADAQPAATPQQIMENAIKIFEKKFWVLNDPKSLTLRLGYRSASPELSAAITNAALDRYLAADAETKDAAINRSEAWLRGRIVDLRLNLEAAEQAVEDFRASHDLATIGERSPLQEELLQLKGRQIDAQAEVSAARAKVAQQQSGASVAAGADVLGSRLIAGLRQQQAELQSKQADLAAVLGPNHPNVLRVNDELASVTAKIRDEVGRYSQSRTIDLKTAESRLADLSVAIEAVQSKIGAANKAAIKLHSLEQDAAAARSVLDDFTKRYNQDDGAPLMQPDSRVVSRAEVPVDAVSPSYGLTLLAGTLGFAGLGFALSLLVERFRQGFEDVQQLHEELGMFVAGLVLRAPQKQLAGRPRQLAQPALLPPMRELAVTVRALVHSPATPGETRVVLVTSSVPGEGKSNVALSLASGIANGGQRCLLIDGDVLRPSLHTSLGVPATPGLVELTLDRLALHAAVRQVPGERFDFLPAGRPTGDTLGPFAIDRFGGVLDELKRDYDVIVIDSAPVLLASEGVVLSSFADLTLFLVKWRTTPREIARKSAALLTRCSSGNCVAVLSQVDPKRLRRAGRAEEQYRARHYASG